MPITGPSTTLLNRRSNMTTNFTYPRGAFVGFDHIFNELEQMTFDHRHSKYPPHNVVKNTEDEYLIELAVVGFKESDIDITMHDGILTVKGDREKRRNQELYVHKGISGRKFERSFRLSEFVEVTGADMEDGLLTVHLERILPESKRPRKISINGVLTNDSTSTGSKQLLNETN